MPISYSKNRPGDRKSTRLNSSHTVISYAVFCLKCYAHHPHLTSFPTRRSSDLETLKLLRDNVTANRAWNVIVAPVACTDREQMLTLYAGPSSNTGASSLARENADILFEEPPRRSEEHTSELQSHSDLVCRLLLEMLRPPSTSHLFPYTTLFRSRDTEATAR